MNGSTVIYLIWLFAMRGVPTEVVSFFGGTMLVEHRQFRIPFRVPGDEANLISQLNLYASTDAGKTWKLHTTARASDGHFVFKAAHDGVYWLSVQTEYTEGRKFPDDITKVPPTLKLWIRTTRGTKNAPLTPNRSEPRFGVQTSELAGKPYLACEAPAARG